MQQQMLKIDTCQIPTSPTCNNLTLLLQDGHARHLTDNPPTTRINSYGNVRNIKVGGYGKGGPRCDSK